MAAAVVGVDFGTESCRAGVFDAVTGEAWGFCSEPYPTAFPKPGCAEQDPRHWWRAMGAAVRGAIAAAEASRKPRPVAVDVAALCVDTTCCTVVAFDRDHPQREPLMPAILWMDMRAADQAARVLATKDPAVIVNGAGRGPVSAEWFLPKALWIKEHAPEVWARASVAEFQDWINLRLTGCYVASRNNVGVRWHWVEAAAADGAGGSNKEEEGDDPTPAHPPLSLLRALGIEEELRARWPGEKVLELGARVGDGLTAEAAEHLGLKAGTIVAQGGADAFIGMLGLGVTKAGEMAMLTVSSFFGAWGRAKTAAPRGSVGARARASCSLLLLLLCSLPPHTRIQRARAHSTSDHTHFHLSRGRALASHRKRPTREPNPSVALLPRGAAIAMSGALSPTARSSERATTATTGGPSPDAAAAAAAATATATRSRSRSAGGGDANARRPFSPPLPMEPLPRDVERPLPAPAVDWPSALGNAADAAVAADALRALLADAVFLDEEAFSSADGGGGGGGGGGGDGGNLSAAQRYHSRLAAARERERALELSLRALRDEVARAGEALEAAREEARAQRARADDLASQLEASQRVFALHYEEIALRTAECERLKGVVEALSGGARQEEGAAAAATGAGAAAGSARGDGGGGDDKR